VLAASLRNRTAVAERILALQEQRGERTIVAIIAAGEPADADGGTRFTIEDQLTAGAVVDALVSLGIDHTSPEAAVASAAFEGLRHAAVHLIGASGSGAALTAAGLRAEMRLATERDITTVVPEWRDGAFSA
jgi:2-phosphosulfolactate phosphatase